MIYVPGIILSTLHILIHLILTITPWDKQTLLQRIRKTEVEEVNPVLKVTELLTSTGWIQTVWLQSLWAVTCSTRAMPRDLKVISKREELHKLLSFLHSYLHTSSFHNSTSTRRRKPTHRIATSCSHHRIGRFSLSSLPYFLTLLYFKLYKKQLSLFKKTHISKSKQN